MICSFMKQTLQSVVKRESCSAHDGAEKEVEKR